LRRFGGYSSLAGDVLNVHQVFAPSEEKKVARREKEEEDKREEIIGWMRGL
jgi:hypothetical protein